MHRSAPTWMKKQSSTPPSRLSTASRRTGSSISNITVATSSSRCGISGL
jgi:hypothetical protein